MSRSAIRTSALALGLALGAAPAGAQRPTPGDDESAALVGEGRAALKRHALDDAAKALDQALALNPRRVEAYVLRATVYAERKQYPEGILLLRRARALAPGDEDVLTALGSQLVLSGDTAAGVPLLEQVVARNPARYLAELRLGHHWHAIGRWSEAITALEAYFAHRPPDLSNEDGWHRVDLADAYLRDHQAPKAFEAFQQAAREGQPGHPDLRARLGAAWAAAAIDCRLAQPLLRELEPVADAHPEIWLVEGQCALVLGDTAAAIDRGQRYLGRARHGQLAGHVLVGEAYAARGNLAEARHAFEAARALEPARRRWTVRLAFVLRSSGDAGGALAALDELGPPAPVGSDPDWWLELGNALLAVGDRQAVITRLGPITAELPGNAAIRAVLGTAQLGAGAPEAAVKTFDEADAVASTPRSRQDLARALAIVAVARLGAGDPAAAEPMLARAAQLAESAVILRGLGIAQLAIDRPGDAQATLDRAVALDPAPITLMLDARAHVLAGAGASARPLYARALDTAGDDAVEIAIDWAASELAGGDPAIAVTVLERTAARARSGPLAQRHRAALADARHATGLAALRAGNGGKAVELLKASAEGKPELATTCDLVLAAASSGDAATALKALGEVGGRRCPFPPPADLLAAPILSAFLDGLAPRQAGKVLGRLTALAGKASGPAAVLLGTAIHATALAAADDAYRSDHTSQARTFLTAARGANARIAGEEIAYDLALLELADGRIEPAIVEFERLASKLPEALVALGLAYERQGDPQKALEAWRRASKAGARFAPLADWIRAKERIYGEPP
jgi:tetratricopeptide (TPR) repeat protein